MPRRKRPEPELPAGPARDLVDLFSRLLGSSQLRIGQIASRAGYTPGHVSEVLRGWKAPSPEAAAAIARVLGADDDTLRRARRRAEELQEWRRDDARRRRQAVRPANESGYAGQSELELELARAITHYAAMDAQRNATRRMLGILTVDAGTATATLPIIHPLKNLDVTVKITAGDLLDQDTHLAIGFSDTFDTSTAEDRIIHSSSLQGQLLRKIYLDDSERLDQELAAALAGVAPLSTESRDDKPYGKLARYPLGTIAVLGEPRRLIFATAYGKMGNDLVAQAPVADLWPCYTKLWDAVYRHGQRRALSVPLMGSGLARVDTLDRGNLLRLILLSFVSYSRRRLICHELRIVISPGDIHRVDLAGLPDFLETL